MALLDRLSGISNSVDAPAISTHHFPMALAEWAAGEVTRAEIVAHFALTPDDQTDLDWLQGKYQASANKREFVERLHGILMLAEVRFPGYTTRAEVAGVINRIG